MIAALTIFLLSFANHGYAAESINKSLSIPSPAATSCIEMKQNLVNILGLPTNGAAQQSAKFSILGIRLQAYTATCGQIDQNLADLIFQSY